MSKHRPSHTDYVRELMDNGMSEEDAVADLLKKEQEALQKYGWLVHVVESDDSTSNNFNAHTHGFVDSYNHPDIQITLTMPPAQIMRIFNVIHYRIKDGGIRFQDGEISDQILANGYKVKFIKKDESGRPVLSVILPDPQGHLEEADMDAEYAEQYSVKT